MFIQTSHKYLHISPVLFLSTTIQLKEKLWQSNNCLKVKWDCLITLLNMLWFWRISYAKSSWKISKTLCWCFGSYMRQTLAYSGNFLFCLFSVLICQNKQDRNLSNDALDWPTVFIDWLDWFDFSWLTLLIWLIDWMSESNVSYL